MTEVKKFVPPHDRGQQVDERQANMSQEVQQDVAQAWGEIVAQPEALTDLSERKVVFVAGGGLPSRFGIEKSEIWQAIAKRAENNNIEIAGISFSLEDLTLLGDYYRFLRDDKGMSLHCIDERLVDDVANSSHEVHDKCGACAAVAAAAGIESKVEDVLLAELHQEAKQGVYEDMPDHESMTILVDFHGSDVVLDEKRAELKAKKALPFNVSLPLELISEWAETKGGNAEALIKVLVKWNVQIARNIIEGHHNTLHKLAGETIIVTDQRQVGDHSLLSQAQDAVSSVQHGSMMVIND